LHPPFDRKPVDHYPVQDLVCSPDANGLYPAPPHDDAGHAWHPDDTISGMPGFGALLEEDALKAILDCVKSKWPEPLRRAQANRSRAV